MDFKEMMKKKFAEGKKKAMPKGKDTKKRC